MALPNFLIVGAMKAGTTSLSDALSQHPDVFIPASKEPNSLVSPSILTRPGLDAYEELFRRGDHAQARGEASTEYTKRHRGGASAAQHARSVLGSELRLVYLVRDPVERGLSHAKHLINSGRGFDQTATILPSAPLCEVGCYSYQIEPWLDAFPSDQLLTIDMHHLVTDWASASTSICDHIGIDPGRLPALGQANASSDARPASGVVGSLLASKTYRGLVQERIPLSLRRRLRRGVVRRVETPELAADQLRWSGDALQRMAEECEAFAEMTGTQIKLPTLQRLVEREAPPTEEQS